MFQHTTASAIPVDLPAPGPRTSILQGLGRVEQILPRTPREYLLWTLVMGVVAGLAALQVAVTLQVHQARQELFALQQEFGRIERDNAQLLWQIGQYTTLERVAQEAARMDFRPTLKRTYLIADPFAGPPGQPTGARPEEPAGPANPQPSLAQDEPLVLGNGSLPTLPWAGGSPSWGQAQLLAGKAWLQTTVAAGRELWSAWAERFSRLRAATLPAQ